MAVASSVTAPPRRGRCAGIAMSTSSPISMTNWPGRLLPTAEDICFEKEMLPDVRAVTYVSPQLLARALEEGNRSLVTAMLWNDVERDLASSQRHFSLAVDLFDELQDVVPSRDQYVRTLGFLHAMQSGYTSFEAGMKRLLALLDEPLPDRLGMAQGPAPPARGTCARVPPGLGGGTGPQTRAARATRLPARRGSRL